MKTLYTQVKNFIDNSQYTEAVNLIAGKFNLEFKAEFLENNYHFQGDKDKRDIYNITLKRGNRKYTFKFGQSISKSGFYYTKGVQKINLDRKYLNKTEFVNLGFYIKNKIDFSFLNNGKSDVIHYPETPTLYDVLACLQKYDIGTFEDFCSEFGCDTDSRKAKKTYKAVVKEYNKICSLFSNDELEVLQLIC